jgi:restriction system protein
MQADTNAQATGEKDDASRVQEERARMRTLGLDPDAVDEWVPAELAGLRAEGDVREYERVLQRAAKAQAIASARDRVRHESQAARPVPTIGERLIVAGAVAASWLGLAWATHSIGLGGGLTAVWAVPYFYLRWGIHEERTARRIREAEVAAAQAWEEQAQLTRLQTEALAEDERRRQLQTLEGWRALTPTAFERECLQLLRVAGYADVQHLGGSGDGGVDLVATQGEERYAVQCKKYQSYISPSHVRDLAGVVAIHGYAGAIFMTSGTVSEGTLGVAKRAHITVYAGDDLVRLADLTSREAPRGDRDKAEVA